MRYRGRSFCRGVGAQDTRLAPWLLQGRSRLASPNDASHSTAGLAYLVLSDGVCSAWAGEVYEDLAFDGEAAIVFGKLRHHALAGAHLR